MFSKRTIAVSVIKQLRFEMKTVLVVRVLAFDYMYLEPPKQCLISSAAKIWRLLLRQALVMHFNKTLDFKLTDTALVINLFVFFICFP